MLELTEPITREQFEEFKNGGPIPSEDIANEILPIIGGQKLVNFMSLSTLRMYLPYKNGYLFIDKSTYLGVVDYELEYEAKSYYQGKQEFIEIINELGIQYKKADKKLNGLIMLTNYMDNKNTENKFYILFSVFYFLTGYLILFFSNFSWIISLMSKLYNLHIVKVYIKMSASSSLIFSIFVPSSLHWKFSNNSAASIIIDLAILAGVSVLSQERSFERFQSSHKFLLALFKPYCFNVFAVFPIFFILAVNAIDIP